MDMAGRWYTGAGVCQHETALGGLAKASLAPAAGDGYVEGAVPPVLSGIHVLAAKHGREGSGFATSLLARQNATIMVELR